MKIKAAIILPAYNEETFLNPLLKKIRKFSSLPIVVVDDGSEKLIKLTKISQLFCLRHELNLGKGSAMITGAEFAFKKLKTNAVVFMDADGQHDPKYLPQFIRLLNDHYDVVFGSRTQTSGVPLVRYLGNKFASIYINILFGVYVSDILSGFRALTKKAFIELKWSSPRYGVEAEMIARLGKSQKRLKFIEIPISTIYIDKYKGVSILDAVKILISSLWWTLS